MAALTWTFLDLKKEVAHFVGWGRDNTAWSVGQLADLVACIKIALQRFYYPESGYTWNFLRPVGTLTTSAPYSTGTVAIVSGVATLTGGTFPSWAAAGEMTVNGSLYTVNTRDGDTQVTLDDTSVAVAAGATYSLSQPVYDLPADFEGFDGPVTYRPGTSQLWPALRLTSDAILRRKRQECVLTSRPEWIAYRPKALTAATGQRFEAVLYPTPSAAYVFEYAYRVVAAMLAEDTDHPYGGAMHADTILAACLSVAEQRLMDAGGREHSEIFARRLATSIELDRRQAAPDYLGYNGSGDSDGGSHRRSRGDVIHTYEGMVHYD